MAAVGTQAGPSADMSIENFSQVFQVLARMHAHPSAEPMTLLAPPAWYVQVRGRNRRQVPEAAAQTVLGAAILHSTQAYELLCLDMPAEEAVLAAAAPPGLLNAARAVWAEAARQASSCYLCVLHSHGFCYLPAAAGAQSSEQPSLQGIGTSSLAHHCCDYRLKRAGLKVRMCLQLL